MLNTKFKFLSEIRGSLRIGTEIKVPSSKEPEFTLSSEEIKSSEVTQAPSWLNESRKLIPGESLAGYISLQPITLAAENPTDARIFLALIFLLVTLILSWIGSQDAKSSNPNKTTQYGVVIIRTFSYIALVYSTGGQIFWHTHFVDQQIYAQIITAALGILGPTIFSKIFSVQA